MGSPLRRKLERRLLAKAGQSALALAPLLTGAAAGALIDHHETRKLGSQVRDDLRKRSGAPAREHQLEPAVSEQSQLVGQVVQAERAEGQRRHVPGLQVEAVAAGRPGARPGPPARPARPACS